MIFCLGDHHHLRNLGYQLPICMECLAGKPECPWEDVSTTPRWESTISLVNPWNANAPSPLLGIPSQTFRPERRFRKDPFHIFKQTLGGHFVASSVVLFLDLGYFERPGLPNNVDAQLEYAHEDFHHFVKKEWSGKTVANLKEFHKRNFPLAKSQDLSLCTIEGE